MIFETEDEVISKPQRKLTWRDALLPTLGAIACTAIAWYVGVQLFGKYLLIVLYRPDSIPVAVAVVFISTLGLLILSIALALRWKTKGRETAKSFYTPPAVVMFGLLSLIALGHKTVPRQPTPSEISARELGEFKQNLNDPNFVMNLKGPLPMAKRLALLSAIDHADSWFSGMKPEELHALLVNVGIEVEPSIARCSKTLPDDLGWIARHGGVAARQEAAINPNTPEEDVESLLTNPDPGVRYFAHRGAARRICNPTMLRSIWYLDKNSPHIDSDIPLSLAKNPCTPGLILGFLNGDPNPAVRKAASTTLKELSSSRH